MVLPAPAMFLLEDSPRTVRLPPRAASSRVAGMGAQPVGALPNAPSSVRMCDSAGFLGLAGEMVDKVLAREPRKAG
jgi:hypothetical protein